MKTNTETCCAEPVFVNMSDTTSQGTPSMDINTFSDSLLVNSNVTPEDGRCEEAMTHSNVPSIEESQLHSEPSSISRIQDVDCYYQEFRGQFTPLLAVSYITTNKANLLFYKGIPMCARETAAPISMTRIQVPPISTRTTSAIVPQHLPPPPTNKYKTDRSHDCKNPQDSFHK